MGHGTTEELAVACAERGIGRLRGYEYPDHNAVRVCVSKLQQLGALARTGTRQWRYVRELRAWPRRARPSQAAAEPRAAPSQPAKFLVVGAGTAIPCDAPEEAMYTMRRLPRGAVVRIDGARATLLAVSGLTLHVGRELATRVLAERGITLET